MLVCTISVCAQRYALVGEDMIPEEGKTYAVRNAGTNTFLSCKHGRGGGMLPVLEDEDVLWQIEPAGERTEAGFELYYIFSVGRRKYIQEVDFADNPGLDGFDIFKYNGFNFELGDKATAAKVTIERGHPGEDMPANGDAAGGESWRINGPATGCVIARHDVVDNPAGGHWFMKFGVQYADVAFQPYNEQVAWQFWTVEQLSPKAELEALVERCSSTEYIVGTEPGYYDQAKVEAFNRSLEEAVLLVLFSATDEQYKAAIDDLRTKRNAVENSVIGITPGYYYMVSGFDDFLNNFSVEKAAYANSATNSLHYRTFDADNIDFVFYVEPATDADEYWVQSYFTDLYVAKGTAWHTSTPQLSSDRAEPQNIRFYTTGKWYWGSRTFHNTSYTPYATSKPVTSDTEGPLTSWGLWGDDSTAKTHFNLWNLRRVPEEKMDLFRLQLGQTDFNKAVKALASDARELYAKLFAYNTDYAKPLIVRASGGADEQPREDAQIEFSSVRSQDVPTADRYEFLLDNNPATYMQGEGSVCVKLDEPVQTATFVCLPLAGDGNTAQAGEAERPKKVSICGFNSLAGEADYGQPVAEDADVSAVESYTVDFGRSVNRIAYRVNQNNSGGSFFTVAEFQMYEATVDKSASKYHTVNGLAGLADEMLQIADMKLALADSGTATGTDVAELNVAIATVRNLYANTVATIDVNGDGQVNSVDVVTVYNVISGAVAGISADANGDGKTDSADVVAIYNYILSASASASPSESVRIR